MGLSKEVCDRFRGLDDFGRNVTRNFNFWIVNDRVMVIVDNSSQFEVKPHNPVIHHGITSITLPGIVFQYRGDFLRRGQSLNDLGCGAHVTPHMGGASS